MQTAPVRGVVFDLNGTLVDDIRFHFDAWRALAEELGHAMDEERFQSFNGLKNVDICPLIPLIENAGGVVTTWDGGPAELGGHCVAAATPELHAAALAVLRG